ncbi:MAG: phage tail length tape measure family protein [Kiloniellaceae bacterium]
MASAGFNIRLSASGVDSVRKALEQMGKGGESALKQIERGSKQANDNGLRAFNTGLREGQQQLQGYASRLGPVGSALTALGPAGLAAAAGIAVVGGGLFKAVTAAEAWEREQLKIVALLKTTQQASGQTGASIEEMARRIGKETLASTAEVRKAAAQLLTFRSVAGDAFERTLTLAQDLAEVFGTSLSAEATRLAKALEDPARNLGSLNEAGISFTQAQQDLIKTLKESGDEAGAFSLILGTIEGQVGGAGQAAAGGLSGGVDSLTEAFGRFIERAGQATGIGDFLGRAFSGAADALDSITDDTFGADTREGLLRQRDRLFDRTLGLGPIDFTSGQRELEDINAKLREMRRLEEEAAAAAVVAARSRQEEAEQAKAQAEAAKAAAAAEKARASARAAALTAIERLEAAAAAAGLEGEEALRHAAEVAHAEQLERYREGALEYEEYARARFAIESKLQTELNELEKDAAEKARQAAVREAEKAATTARRDAEKRDRELEREAEKQAEIMRRPFENALDGIQDSFTDTFEQIFSGGVKTFEDIGEAAKRIFVRLASELAALQLFQGVGIGGTGGTAAAGLGGSGSFNFGGLLSGGGNLLPNWLGGGANVLPGGRPGGVGLPGVGGGFSAAQPFSLGNFLGGAGLGFGAGSLINSLIGGNAVGGTIGSGIGGLAGAGIGSIIPGVGTLLGGLIGGGLGGIFGGLFGGGKSVGPNSFGRFSVKDGQLVAGGTGADNGGNAAQAGELAKAVAQQVNALLDVIGAEFRGKPISYVGSFGNQLGVRSGAYNGGRFDRYFGNDPQAAVEGATLYAFEKGNLEGVEPEVAAAIRKAAKISSDLEDFAKNVGVAQAILGETLFDSTELSAAEQALKDLNEQFEEAAKRAERLGLNVAKLEELRDKALTDLTEGFEEGIRLQILGLTDPLAAALANQTKVAEQRLKEAEVLGASLVEVERLNALERQRIVEQTGGDLKRFFEEITFGSLSGASPGASVEAQRAAFEAAVASGNIGEIERLGRGLLTTSRGAFASGALYQQDLARVQQVVGSYIAGNDTSAMTATMNEGFGGLLVQGAQSGATLEAILEVQIAQQREISRLTSLLEARAA